MLWCGHTKQLPKLDRYTIGEKVFTALLDITVAIYEAQYQKGQTKKKALLAASPKLNSVKMLIRLANSIEVMEEKQYIHVEAELNEIGKMLGGWIKSI